MSGCAVMADGRAARAHGQKGHLLSAREREVAAMISRGMFNREIARSLGISPRTVESHVETILRKLGFRTRTQIAVWATVRPRNLRGKPSPK